MERLAAVRQAGLKTDLPDFHPGDTIKVMVRVREGDKERLQAFEGVCVGRRGGGVSETFMVRKVSAGVGVERIFPLHTSRIEKIEVLSRGEVRRARLNYLRQLQGKAARIKGEKSAPEESPAPAAAAPAPAAEAPAPAVAPAS